MIIKIRRKRGEFVTNFINDVIPSFLMRIKKFQISRIQIKSTKSNTRRCAVVTDDAKRSRKRCRIEKKEVRVKEDGNRSITWFRLTPTSNQSALNQLDGHTNWIWQKGPIIYLDCRWRFHANLFIGIMIDRKNKYWMIGRKWTNEVQIIVDATDDASDWNDGWARFTILYGYFNEQIGNCNDTRNQPLKTSDGTKSWLWGTDTSKGKMMTEGIQGSDDDGTR